MTHFAPAQKAAGQAKQAILPKKNLSLSLPEDNKRPPSGTVIVLILQTGHSGSTDDALLRRNTGLT